MSAPWKSIVRVVAACAMALNATAAPWEQDWTVRDDLRVDRRSSVVAMSRAGDVLVASGDARLVAFRADGQQRWAIAGAGPVYTGYLEATIGDVVVDDNGSAWYTTPPGGMYTEQSVLTRVDENGRPIWSRPVSGAKLARAGDGVVVAGCGWNRTTAVVTKFDGEGGAVWQKSLPLTGCDSIALDVVANGSVYVVQHVPFEGRGRAFVTRLDVDGVLRQSAVHDTRAAMSWLEPPAMTVRATEQTVYIGRDRWIQALEPADLSIRWFEGSCALADLLPAGMHGMQDMLCVADASVRRLDAKTGVQLWSAARPFTASIDVRASGDSVFEADGTSLRRRDASTGALLWETHPSTATEFFESLGIGHVADDHVGFASVVCRLASDSRCAASILRVAIADGSIAKTVRARDVPSNLTGRVYRDGNDIGVAAIATSATDDQLSIRVAASSDGAVRWEDSRAFEHGARIEGVTMAFGQDFVAVAVGWWRFEETFFERKAAIDVFVYDRSTGQQRWSSRLRDGDECDVGSPALIVDNAGNLVLAAWIRRKREGIPLHCLDSGVMRRLDSADGTVLWSAEGLFDNATAVLRRVGSSVLSNRNGLSRIDPDDGHLVWSSDMSVSGRLPLVELPGGDLAVAGIAVGGELVVARIDSATGEDRWRTSFGGAAVYIPVSVVASADNELSIAGYVTTTAGNVSHRPFIARIDSQTGATVGSQTTAMAPPLHGEYIMLDASGDGRLWAGETRKFGNETSLRTTWLTELDSDGRPMGRRALRMTPFSDLRRSTFWVPETAPRDGMIAQGGLSIGGGGGQGYAIAALDTRTTSEGDLELSLDPVAPMRPGRPFAFGATVRYAGTAATTATLFVQLPWAGAGAPPSCSPRPDVCAVDSRSGWHIVRLALDPQSVVRVEGKAVAGELDSAYDSRRGEPRFQGVVVGETGLRESSIDNNFSSIEAPMSLFANGFE